MVKVAINGFGRIGRLIFRIIEENPEFNIVAINEFASPNLLAHLLEYEAIQINYKKEKINSTKDFIIVGERKIRVFNETDLENLPWKDLDIDIVLECTAKDKEMNYLHTKAGAKKVISFFPTYEGIKELIYNDTEKTSIDRFSTSKLDHYFKVQNLLDIEESIKHQKIVNDKYSFNLNKESIQTKKKIKMRTYYDQRRKYR